MSSKLILSNLQHPAHGLVPSLPVIEWIHSPRSVLTKNQPPLFRFANHQIVGANHDRYSKFKLVDYYWPGALPWWPYTANGRLRHHRPWDWLSDTPSWEQRREALGGQRTAMIFSFEASVYCELEWDPDEDSGQREQSKTLVQASH
jgi:hypothetical protein